MGTDYTTNLGPYVECKTGKVEKTLTKKACTNKKCETFGKERSSPFCDKCGGKIDDYSYKVKGSKIDPWDVMEELDEVLRIPSGDYIHNWAKKNDTDLWISNRRQKKGEREHSFDPTEYVGVTDINLELMREEVCDFMLEFKKEIDILRKHYGSENVSVKWGLINTIH